VAGLAWVALVPLLSALEEKGVWTAFLLSTLTGLILFPGVCYWVWAVDAFQLLDFLLLGTYLALYIGAWGGALTWVRKRTGLSVVVVAPPLWIACEYLRSYFWILSAPWMLLGHSQYLHPMLIQITAVTGVHGLSFLIVFVNAAIAETVCHLRRRWRLSPPDEQGAFPWLGLAVSGALVLTTLLYGECVLRTSMVGPSLRVAIIQPNVSNQEKWEKNNRQKLLDHYARLTQEAARQTPRLIVWPETAVPGDVQHDPQLFQAVSRIAVAVQTPLLVGSGEKALFTDRRLVNRYYNSLFLFSSDGHITGQYRKMALVPFGEYVPLRDVITWPQALAAMLGDYVPGDRYTIFPLEKTHFGAVICWELIFPELVREFVRRGARFMVIATNEAWFGETAAPYQLLAMSVFRAVENRVAIVRAANTGISAFIDPFGRITERLQSADLRELFVEGVLTSEVPLAEGQTWYTRHGDMFAFLQILWCVGLFYAAWRGARNRSR
jgi:apolipoprotein N-acyltransferase